MKLTIYEQKLALDRANAETATPSAWDRHKEIYEEIACELCEARAASQGSHRAVQPVATQMIPYPVRRGSVAVCDTCAKVEAEVDRLTRI